MAQLAAHEAPGRAQRRAGEAPRPPRPSPSRARGPRSARRRAAPSRRSAAAAAPRRTPLRARGRSAGTPASARATSTAQTGTLIPNTQRQPSPSTRTPPSSGPSARPAPEPAPHMPMARARAAGSRNAVGDDRQRGRERQRRAERLHHAPGQQPLHASARPRTTASPPANSDEPGQQRRAPAVAVGRHAAGDQQRGEDQDEGVDDPLQLGRRGPQVAPELGQRDRDDRRRGDVDQLRRRDRREHAPRAREVGARGAGQAARADPRPWRAAGTVRAWNSDSSAPAACGSRRSPSGR